MLIAFLGCTGLAFAIGRLFIIRRSIAVVVEGGSAISVLGQLGTVTKRTICTECFASTGVTGYLCPIHAFTTIVHLAIAIFIDFFSVAYFRLWSDVAFTSIPVAGFFIATDDASLLSCFTDTVAIEAWMGVAFLGFARRTFAIGGFLVVGSSIAVVVEGGGAIAVLGRLGTGTTRTVFTECFTSTGAAFFLCAVNTLAAIIRLAVAIFVFLFGIADFDWPWSNCTDAGFAPKCG
jgi:hypothetical protein